MDITELSGSIDKQLRNLVGDFSVDLYYQDSKVKSLKGYKRYLGSRDETFFADLNAFIYQYSYTILVFGRDRDGFGYHLTGMVPYTHIEHCSEKPDGKGHGESMENAVPHGAETPSHISLAREEGTDDAD